MADHPHAAMYRQLIEAFNEGNFQAFYDAVADDVEWWEVGATEAIRGKEAVSASMQAGLSDSDIRADLHDVVANDEHLIALIEATATRGDQVFEYRTVEIHHVNAEGQITHRWSFADNTQAVIDFFS